MDNNLNPSGASDTNSYHNYLQDSSLNAFCDQLPVALAIYQPDRKLVKCNTQFRSIFGIGGLAQTNKLITEFVAIQSQSNFLFHLKDIQLTNKPQSCTLTMLMSKGQEVEVKLDSVILETPQGLLVQTVFSDISSIIRHEVKLESEKTHLQAILHSSPVAMLVIDENLRISNANIAAQKLLSTNLADLERKYCGDFLGCKNRLLEEKGCGYSESCKTCHIMNSLKLAIEKGEAVENLETFVQHDTSFVNGPLWLKLSSTPIFLQGSRHCLLALNDITNEKLQEVALRASEQKYRLLAEKTSDTIWLLGFDAQSLYVSPSVEQFSGFTPEEYLKQTIEDRFTAESAIKARKLLEETAQHINDIQSPDIVYLIELDYKCKDGSVKTGELKITPFFENGKLLGIHGVTRDITQRKLTEEKLRNEQLLLRTLIDNLPDTIYVKDANAKKILANRKDLQVMGYNTEDEVIGKDDLELLAGNGGELGYADDMKVLRNRIPVIDREECIKDRKGNPVWLRTTKLPIINDANEVTGLVGIGHIFTEQKKVEDALMYEKALLKSLIDNIPISVFIKDRQSRKVLSNPYDQYYTQKTEQEVIGHDDYELFAPELAKGFIEDDRSVIETGKPIIQKEESIVYADGSERHMLTTKIPWFNGKGEIDGIIGFSLDITDRKLALKALVESEERFRAAFRISPDAISISDLQTGEYVDVNDGFIEISGYSREQLIGFTSLERNVWHNPEDRKKVIETLQKQGFISDFEAVFTLNNNKKIIGLFSARVLEIGGKQHLLSVTKDITDRRKALDALRESEEKLKVLINSTPDLICFKDAQGRWIQANNGLLDIYCLQGVDYHNKTDFELAGFTAKIYQDAFRNCGATDELAWETQRPSRTIEYIPDIQENVHIFDVLKIPLFNPDNSRKGLVVFGRDITESKNNEEALAKKEEKYRLIAENTGDTIWIMDLDFKYSYISPAILRLTGNTPEEEIKRTLDEILTPSSLQIAIDAFNHELEHDSDPAIDMNRTMNLDLEIYHKDGHIVYVRETMTFIRDENGKPIAIQGITHDISDRVIAAQQIQINEYRLQSLLRLSEYKTDNVQQLFDYALNDALLLFGCEFGIVLSYDSTAQTLTPTTIAGTATSLFPKSPTLLAYPLESSGPWASPIYTKDELLLNIGHLQTEDHSIIPIPIDKVRNLMAIPLIIDDVVVSIIAIGNRQSDFAQVDIQQLKLMMHSVWKMVQRRKDEDKIRQLSKGIEQSPAAVVITDLDGKIEYVNSRFTEVTGHPKDKVMGKVMRILKPGITPPELYNQIWSTIKGGNDWKGEFYNKRADNSYYWEDVSISPITDYKGAITHYIAIKEDITDRKKMIDELILAKEQAEEVSRIKSSLLANMSHEIRTPLNGILGFAELLKEDAKDENQQHMAEIIYSSGSRLMNTLNSILDLSLIEAQSDAIKLKPIDLNLLIQESTMLYNAMAARKGLYLNNIISNEPMMALGDENLINKIINNLVNNAIKFTKTGGVTVRGAVKQKEQTAFACILVEDTGIGIPDEYKDIIFKEFRQASEGHTRAFEGTGLGLHIAARFAQVMGGEITVESTLGQGSCFTFWLPMELSSMPDPTLIKEEPIIIPKLTVSAQKILVVDDDKDSMDLAMMILRKLYNCDFAENGVKAVELAKQNHYACILMDISLRGEIGGIEAIRQIRLIPGYSKTPIAAFTANALAGHREEYLRKGCTHYLAKPYRKQDLLKMIDEMVYSNRIHT